VLPLTDIPQYALTHMDILYHYCSTASFHAIIQSHALWLSSLSLSNDTLVGKLVARTIDRLAERDSLAYEKVSLLKRGIRFFEETFDGLGFCLSEEGDLLSQWRGYAGDATGVAIGFSKKYLERLTKVKKSQDKSWCILQKGKYDPSAHDACVEPTYRKVTLLIENGTLKAAQPLGIMHKLTDQEIAVAEIAAPLASPVLTEVACVSRRAGMAGFLDAHNIWRRRLFSSFCKQPHRPVSRGQTCRVKTKPYSRSYFWSQAWHATEDSRKLPETEWLWRCKGKAF